MWTLLLMFIKDQRVDGQRSQTLQQATWIVFCATDVHSLGRNCAIQQHTVLRPIIQRFTRQCICGGKCIQLTKEELSYCHVLNEQEVGVPLARHDCANDSWDATPTTASVTTTDKVPTPRSASCRMLPSVTEKKTSFFCVIIWSWISNTGLQKWVWETQIQFIES